MSRNWESGLCEFCGLTVEHKTGFVAWAGDRPVFRHAKVPGDGRITCVAAKAAAVYQERVKLEKTLTVEDLE